MPLPLKPRCRCRRAAPVAMQVFVVRHAESLQNERRQLLNTTGSLWHLLAWMAESVRDSPLSTRGEASLSIQRQHVVDSQLLSKVSLVVHSPLVRAVATCHGVFAGHGVPLLEHAGCHEQDAWETLRLRSLEERVSQFKQWLLGTGHASVVVVSHGSFLREFCHSSTALDNCEIREVWLHADGTCDDRGVRLAGC